MKWFTLTFLLVLSGIAIAQEVSLQFEQANQLYRNGEYQKAEELYEPIIKKIGRASCRERV